MKKAEKSEKELLFKSIETVLVIVADDATRSEFDNTVWIKESIKGLSKDLYHIRNTFVSDLAIDVANIIDEILHWYENLALAEQSSMKSGTRRIFFYLGLNFSLLRDFFPAKELNKRTPWEALRVARRNVLVGRESAQKRHDEKKEGCYKFLKTQYPLVETYLRGKLRGKKIPKKSIDAELDKRWNEERLRRGATERLKLSTIKAYRRAIEKELSKESAWVGD